MDPFASISALRRGLRRGDFSSLELTRLYLDRLETIGRQLNALAEPTRPLAERQARKADRAIRNGDRRPLLGVPYGAKDLLDTAGIPTRWGSPAHADRVPSDDATVIARLRDAGAPLLGKLAMVELAGGGGYDSPAASLHGPGLNPWNLEHWAGGSSSGSGAATAAGLVGFSLGSETIGSIMSPSAFCGVTGLRPSRGAVSLHGAMSLGWSLDKIGPMCRSAADCELVFAAIAGRDPLDPQTDERDYKRAAANGLRLGVIDSGLDKADPSIAQSHEDALRALRKAGFRLRKIALPKYSNDAWAILSVETVLAHGEFIRSERLKLLADTAQRKGLRGALKAGATAYSEALQRRIAATREIRSVFTDVDALVAPLFGREAPAAKGSFRRALSGGVASPDPQLGAIAGLPGLALPIGLGPNGLPIALSLTGDLHRENVLLAIGKAFQRETDWHLRRPGV